MSSWDFTSHLQPPPSTFLIKIKGSIQAGCQKLKFKKEIIWFWYDDGENVVPGQAFISIFSSVDISFFYEQI